MNGLDIVNGVYRRLRRPDQNALPWQDVLSTVRDVVARKKLDLTLAEQNNAAITSDWFTPSSQDTVLTSEVPILLPIALERRSVGSAWTSGAEVPIVNYEVLNSAAAGSAAFYGNPLRLVLLNDSDYIGSQQYRLVYEPDFADDYSINDTGGSAALSADNGLPSYVKELIEIEAAWSLIDDVLDESPEWIGFKNSKEQKWALEIQALNQKWSEYVRIFRGRARVPKRTLFDNMRSAPRTRWFKG